MAVRWYPSSRDRVEIVCTTDPDLAAANPPDALERYAEDGDLSQLVIPAGVSRFWIAPLDGPTEAQAKRDATALVLRLTKDATAILNAKRAQKAAAAGVQDVDSVDVGDDDLSDDEKARLISARVWNDWHALALCQYSVKAIGDHPDVAPAVHMGLERYPDSLLRRLEAETIREIAGHVQRISRLSPEGKAS